MPDDQLATRPLAPSTASITIGPRGIALNTFEDLWKFSTAVSKSGLAPKGIESVEAVLVAIQMGLEVGLTPMSALQNIAVINGRPGIFGDAALALVRSSGLCDLYEQDVAGEGDKREALVKSKRRGGSTIVTTFSVADAKKAGLWNKTGPWQLYPDRMLMWRARGFNLRDNFGDVLRGFRTVEELQDYDLDPERNLPMKKANVRETVPPSPKVHFPQADQAMPSEPAAEEEQTVDERVDQVTSNVSPKKEKKVVPPGDAEGKPGANMVKLESLLGKFKITEREFIASLQEFEIDTGEARESGTIADLPEKSLAQSIKQFETLKFNAEKVRKTKHETDAA